MSISWLKPLVFLFQIVMLSLSLKIKLQSSTSYTDISKSDWSSILESIPYTIPTMNICIEQPLQCFDLVPSLTTSMSFVQNRTKRDKLYPGTPQYPPKQYNRYLGFMALYKKISGRLAQDFTNQPNDPYHNNNATDSNTNTNNKSKPKINTTRVVIIIDSAFDEPFPPSIDGLLGFQKLYTGHETVTHPQSSYMKFLQKANIIQRKTFALIYSKDDSYIELGEDYSNYNKQPKCISPISDIKHQEWDCNLNEIVIGNDIGMYITNKQIVSFDSMSKTILIPLQYKYVIFDKLLNDLFPNQCILLIEKVKHIIQCDDSIDLDFIPDINLIMDNKVTLVLKWSNIFKLANINDGSGNRKYVSMLILEELNTDKWKIGLPGMMDNKIIFNLDDSSVMIIDEGRIKGLRSSINMTLYYFICCLLVGGISYLISLQREVREIEKELRIVKKQLYNIVTNVNIIYSQQ